VIIASLMHVHSISIDLDDVGSTVDQLARAK